MYHKYKMHKYFKSFNYQRSIEIPCAWSQLREMLTYTGVGPGGVIKQKSQKPLLWDVNWVRVCVVIKEIPWAGLHHSGRTGSGRRCSHQRGGVAEVPERGESRRCDQRKVTGASPVIHECEVLVFHWPMHCTSSGGWDISRYNIDL